MLNVVPLVGPPHKRSPSALRGPSQIALTALASCGVRQVAGSPGLPVHSSEKSVESATPRLIDDAVDDAVIRIACGDSCGVRSRALGRRNACRPDKILRRDRRPQFAGLE